MNKVGKNTPVWINTSTGKVICGKSVQDGLGVGFLFDVDKNWVRATKLPSGKRIVIDEDGIVLPQNDLTVAIARAAKQKGKRTVNAHRRTYTFILRYVDDTKVILAKDEPERC